MTVSDKFVNADHTGRYKIREMEMGQFNILLTAGNSASAGCNI